MPETSEEIDRLRAELAELRAEVTALRRGAETRARSAPRATSSRREVLQRLGSVAGLAALGGAGAAALADSTPAAATEPALFLNDSNPATDSTEIRVQPSADLFSHVFSANDGSWLPRGPSASNTPDTGTRAALAGYAGNSVIHGGFFQTNAIAAGAAGIRVNGESPSAYGIRVKGRRASLLIDRHDSEPPAPVRLDLHAPGEVVHDSAGDLWFCVGAGSPGVWRKVSGPSTSGQLHLLASPVRCYDSRDGFTPLGVVKGVVSSPRLVDCRVTADGSAAVVPADALGLVVNVTAVDTTGAGFLAVYPGGTSFPGTSLLNYGLGSTVANSTSVGCGPGATLTVRCGGAGVGHVIVDVMGYYR